MASDARHPATDAALVAQVRRGDREAFALLIERHLGLVHVIACSRLADREAAEDLAQEVYLRAFLSLERLRDPNRFAPWLAQITRHEAASWRRRAQRRSELALMVPFDERTHDLPDASQVSPPEAMESSEAAKRAWGAIRDLPESEREVVLLHFAEGMAAPEIASRLGLHRTTVTRRIKRGMRLLRARVEPRLAEEAPALRPSRRLAVRTTALIMATWALSPETRASIVATAGPAPAMAAGVTKVVEAFAAGGKAMMSAKVVGGIIVIAAATGAVVHMTKGKEEAPAMAPDATQLTTEPPGAFGGGGRSTGPFVAARWADDATAAPITIEPQGASHEVNLEEGSTAIETQQ